MKRYLATLAIFMILASGQVFAQLLPLAYFQNNQTSLINPGAWNMDILKYSFMPRHNAGIHMRSQYLGIDRAPANLLVHYDFMPNQNILAGFQLLGDQFGPFGSGGMGLKYAHRVSVSKTGFISGGVQAQFTVTAYNPSRLTDYNADDPFSNLSLNGNGLHISAGLFYSDILPNPKWQYCVGAAYLNLSSSQLGNSYHFRYLPVWMGQFHLYRFIDERSERVSFIEGSLILRAVQNYASNLDFRIRYQHKGLVGIQGGMRSSAYQGDLGISGVHLDLNILVGRFLKMQNRSLDFNYSIELPTGVLGSQALLSHEIGLGLLF